MPQYPNIKGQSLLRRSSLAGKQLWWQAHRTRESQGSSDQSSLSCLVTLHTLRLLTHIQATQPLGLLPAHQLLSLLSYSPPHTQLLSPLGYSLTPAPQPLELLSPHLAPPQPLRLLSPLQRSTCSCSSSVREKQRELKVPVSG